MQTFKDTEQFLSVITLITHIFYIFQWRNRAQFKQNSCSEALKPLPRPDFIHSDPDRGLQKGLQVACKISISCPVVLHLRQMNKWRFAVVKFTRVSLLHDTKEGENGGKKNDTLELTWTSFSQLHNEPLHGYRKWHKTTTTKTTRCAQS